MSDTPRKSHYRFEHLGNPILRTTEKQAREVAGSAIAGFLHQFRGHEFEDVGVELAHAMLDGARNSAQRRALVETLHEEFGAILEEESVQQS